MERPAERTSYRMKPDLGPDPVTEADAITELIHRTTRLRRRLLALTIAVAILGGTGGVMLYALLATRIYGRVGGAFFAAGAILTFAVVRRLCGLVARAREAAWVTDLAGRHALRAEALADALAMFDG